MTQHKRRRIYLVRQAVSARHDSIARMDLARHIRLPTRNQSISQTLLIA